ncbi:MAG: hypothetical protein H7Y00_00305, partial [Fimbriimonadaceae bacterium]|nr:hypothetical protein [Chitinophagales bacterium]
LCIAHEPKRKTHTAWNTGLINYVKKTGDLINGTDVHLYLAEELKTAAQAHPKQITFKKNTYYEQLDSAFQKYIRIYKQDKNFETFIAYYKKELPGKLLFCTEFGDKPAEYWLNTIANAGHTFEIFCKYRNEFRALLVHNFMSNWMWASRRPEGKYDDNIFNTKNINRCHWYSLQMANEIPYDAKQLSTEIKIENSGTYFFYFNNAGEKKYLPKIQMKNILVPQYEIHFVTGEYTYSSAGQTGFMGKGSEKSMEVKEINIVTSEKIEEIPANAFGYVKIVVE